LSNEVQEPIMSIATIPRSILRLQYQLVRIPLQLIEDRVVTRLDSEAPARLIYERSLGVLDATVGSALGDRKLKNQGASLAKRSDELARASQLDGAASQKKKQADAELKTSREEAVEDLKDAQAAREDAVDEALLGAEERKRAAAQRANKSAATAKQHADEVANRRKEAARQAEQRDLNKIRAAEKEVTSAANAKLEDAHGKRQEAEDKRAQANRVEHLAEAEKAKRTAKS
jgi:hypothetical protein